MLLGEVYGKSWPEKCLLYLLSEEETEKETKEETMADPMPPLCLFCLEELKETDDIQNVIGCQCEIHSHGRCLQDWFQQKQQFECPICHAISVPNPVQPTPHPPEVIYIHIPDPQREARYRTIEGREKCVGFCCLMIVIWWIGGIILEYAL